MLWKRFYWIQPRYVVEGTRMRFLLVITHCSTYYNNTIIFTPQPFLKFHGEERRTYRGRSWE